MDAEAIAEFVTKHVVPIKDLYGLDAYRCAAYTVDGVYLPCVLIRSAARRVAQAIKRFDDTRNNGITDPNQLDPSCHVAVVKSFVCTGNRINDYDIDRLEESPFAIPAERMAEIGGETAMSWSEFTVVMDDGKEFFFGTQYLTEFFHMPKGYTGKNIAKIVAHESERAVEPIYRERLFFECFLDGGPFSEDQSA